MNLIDCNYWKNRWENNDTSWHTPETHPLLIQLLDTLKLRECDTVFVPLCGASIDMLYLTKKGYFVIGNEISPLACEHFFIKNEINYKKTHCKDFDLYKGDNILLYCGDYFNLTPELLGRKVSAVYDRAALIALPESLRRRYVNKLFTLLSPSMNTLLITIEYENERNAPPYLVDEKELYNLYCNDYNLELLGKFNNTPVCQRLRERGFVGPCERAYLIRSKA